MPFLRVAIATLEIRLVRAARRKLRIFLAAARPALRRGFGKVLRAFAPMAACAGVARGAPQTPIMRALGP